MAKYAILQSFYSSELWQNLRAKLIAERKPKCEHCKKIISDPKKIIAHHTKELTPENVNDYSISLNPELIELVCFDCHNKDHNRFGYVGDKKVIVVFGAPLSGKHTFVRQHMNRGDIMIDMDSLYEAVSMLPSFDKPDNLLSNVKGIYNQLIDNIKTRYGKWNNAWIIGGYADKYSREKITNDLGAELVYCECSKQECFNRLELDEDRKHRKTEWKQYIEKWFDKYTV